MKTLQIKDLHVQVEGKEILRGVNLTVKENEIHALMGPNGNGKSTLLYGYGFIRAEFESVNEIVWR